MLDEVVGMVVADPDGSLLTICENGHGKRTPFGANTAGEAEEEEPGNTSQESAEVPSPGMSAAIPGDQAAEEAGPEDRSGMRYRKQRRGGKGLRDIRTSERNGAVVGILSVRDGDDVMLITSQGMVNRTHVHEIRLIGRNTQGVRVMNLNEGDKIASLAKVAKDDVDETNGGKPPEQPPPAATEPPSPTS